MDLTVSLNDPGGIVRIGPMGGAPERVYLGVRERILRFDLPPGATLGRKELAEAHGVSQTPVRDALQRLAQEGLVRIYPQSKTVVTRIDVRELSETQFLRVAIETEVVRRLATAGRDEAIARARAIIQMQQTLSPTTEEMRLFTELDLAFHRTLFEAIGMENLHNLLLSRLGHLYRCQRLELPRRGKMEDIIDAHVAILDGIVSGDPDLAAGAVRNHLSGTINRIETLREDYPDYFTEGELLGVQTPPE